MRIINYIKYKYKITKDKRDNSVPLSLQDIRNLRGLILFLLTLKSASILRLNRNIASSAVMSTHLLSRLFWPMVKKIKN